MKEFLGQEVATKVGEEKDIHRVSKKGLNKILAERGVTDEVRKTVEEAYDDIQTEGLNAVAVEADKTKKGQELILGSGNGSLTIGVRPKQTNFDPASKKPIVKYAVPYVRRKCSLTKGTKDQFAETHKGLQKAFKSK